MKLLKLETKTCTKCPIVSQYLTDRLIDFEAIDVEEYPDVAGKYGVMGVPVTILVDDNGNEVERSTGFNPDELDVLIKQL